MRRFGRARLRAAVVVAGALSLLVMYQGASTGSGGPGSVAEALKISQDRVDAINDINDVPAVTQNLIPGTLEARDVAVTRFKAAGADAAPGSKPEYAVVWAGKNNIGDMSGNDWMRFVNQGSISPTGLLNVGTKQWLAGLDAMVVVDVRRSNVDGTPNNDYGKVVNFVQVPPPFGVEGEPHHMQYEWQPGQPDRGRPSLHRPDDDLGRERHPQHHAEERHPARGEPPGHAPRRLRLRRRHRPRHLHGRPRRAQLRRFAGLGRGLQARLGQGHGPGVRDAGQPVRRRVQGQPRRHSRALRPAGGPPGRHVRQPARHPGPARPRPHGDQRLRRRPGAGYRPDQDHRAARLAADVADLGHLRTRRSPS